MFKSGYSILRIWKETALTPSAIVPFLPAERKLEGRREKWGRQGGRIDETEKVEV